MDLDATHNLIAVAQRERDEALAYGRRLEDQLKNANDTIGMVDLRVIDLESQVERLKRELKDANDYGAAMWTRTQDLEEELEDLDLAMREATARAIGRNSDYERELQEIKDKATEIGTSALTIAKLYDEAKSQRRFLTHTLLALVMYEGMDVSVMRDMAAVAIRDWLPTPEEADADES